MSRVKKLVIIGSGVILLTVFILWGPVALIERTSSPQFCGNTCHVMEKQYESWFMTGLHREIKCVDCHLPNNNPVNHLVWKGIDGMKDVIYFYSGLYSDNIKISDHGKSVVKKNCLKCHEGMTMVMNTEGRTCWSCHRRVKHTFPVFAKQ